MYWDHAPYFTLGGLVRLVHHVIATFIARREVLAREDYPKWRAELPGIVRLQLAPQYWIWQTEGFTPSDSRRRFAGLLARLAEVFERTQDRTVPDMSPLMQRVQVTAKNCREADRRTLVALYRVCDARHSSEAPERQAFLDEYDSYRDECSIENLAIWPLLYTQGIRWSVAASEAAFAAYLKESWKQCPANSPGRRTSGWA